MTRRAAVLTTPDMPYSVVMALDLAELEELALDAAYRVRQSATVSPEGYLIGREDGGHLYRAQRAVCLKCRDCFREDVAAANRTQCPRHLSMLRSWAAA